MIIICTLIVLDWLYLAWLKLRPICFKLRKALFPTGKSYKSNKGHKQVCLAPEIWVDLLGWIPPEQIATFHRANARLRDIVDEHRERLPRQRRIILGTALNATILSLHMDSLLRCLLLLIIMFFNVGLIQKYLAVFLLVHLEPQMSLRSYTFMFHENPTFRYLSATLVGKVWPRHSKRIVRICERMGTLYDWDSDVRSVRYLSLYFDLLYISILFFLPRFFDLMAFSSD